MIKRVLFVCCFVFGGSLCMADEVVVLRDREEVRLEGFVSFAQGKLLLETPYGTLEFPEGTWKQGSVVRGDPCDDLNLRKDFLSYYVSRADYKRARDEIDRIRTLCSEENQPSEFWDIYAEAMDYLQHAESLRIAMSQIDDRRLNQAMGLTLEKSEVEQLDAAGGAFDDLTKETKAVIDAQAAHSSNRTRNALKYDALALMVDLSNAVAARSKLKPKKTDKMVMDYWRENFAPRLEPMPWLARLLHRKPKLRDLHEAWETEDSGSAAWAVVDSATAVLNEKADEALAALSYGAGYKLYESEIQRLYEVPRKPLTGLPTPEEPAAVGEYKTLGEFKASTDYRSSIGCALQMYNAGPGRGRQHNCRVPITSTIEYVNAILADYSDPASGPKSGEFDDLISAELENLGTKREPELNLELIKALIHRESRFDPEASGLAGEKGLMQIMPGTWNEVYLQWEVAPGCSFHEKGHDPACNIKIGVNYLNHCIKEARKQLDEKTA